MAKVICLRSQYLSELPADLEAFEMEQSEIPQYLLQQVLDGIDNDESFYDHDYYDDVEALIDLFDDLMAKYRDGNLDEMVVIGQDLFYDVPMLEIKEIPVLESPKIESSHNLEQKARAALDKLTQICDKMKKEEEMEDAEAAAEDAKWQEQQEIAQLKRLAEKYPDALGSRPY